MEDYQKRFSELISDVGALFFDKDLILKDGRPTPYFFNSGKFNSGEMNSKLGVGYADMLVRTGLIDSVDIIYGPSYKGSAIAVGTANALWSNYKRDKKIEYDRKEAKAHGESTKKENLFVNKTLFDGCRIFIVDDVWTSGATKYENIEKIKKEAETQGYNVKIIGIGIAVDREQVGPIYDESKPKDLPNKERVILDRRGEHAIKKFTEDTEIPVYSIVGIRDAVNYLYNTNYPLMINGEMKPMDAQTLEKFNQYMETYGVEKLRFSSYPTKIAGINFSNCIFNASGPLCETLEELKTIGESNSAAVLMKSCTLDKRQGNPEPRYSDLEFGSINSMGLPNLGCREYVRFSDELKSFNKPVIASVSGLSLEENLEMINLLNNSSVDMIELNLSCPNIPGKPIVGYDFEQANNVLERVRSITRKPLGVKLPPYFDMVHFEKIANILNKHRVSFVSCVNSVGNALVIDADSEEVLIKPKEGFGGLGGKYIKPVALANVRMFYKLLDPSIDIIGVGGIYTGKDVFEFILAGAKAVQLATVFMQEGEGCFERIEQEFNQYIAKKGYSSIEEIRGRLKTK